MTQKLWQEFQTDLGLPHPILLHFPVYTKYELLNIMTKDVPEKCSPALYKTYCSLLFNIFHKACNNLMELRHQAVLNFPKFFKPILDGEATENQVGKLWKNVQGHLKEALRTLYLREISRFG